MRGLAITNSPLLRRIHNSLARYVLQWNFDNTSFLIMITSLSPADIRTSLNSIAIETLNSKQKESGRKARTAKSSQATKTEERSEDENVPTYHFIGYVPAFGKVWELDGLKSGPLEVGELTSDPNRNGWMEVARPALRIKMAKYGGSGLEDGDIRFSLLAIVPDAQMKLTDDLEFLKLDKQKLESQMEKGWEQKVIILVVPGTLESYV
jgi:ubiquitin carboxyl-terminal hydrolase L5